MVFALVEQLKHPEKKVQLQRVNALLIALSRASLIDRAEPVCRPACRLNRVLDVRAEKVTGAGKRIDLFISGQSEGKALEVLVEVKLGHSLTPGQLQSYTKDPSECLSENMLLFVSAPRLTTNDAAQIRLANKDRPQHSLWHFIDLRQLIIEYACALPAEHDDEEFARVRMSVQILIESWF